MHLSRALSLGTHIYTHAYINMYTCMYNICTYTDPPFEHGHTSRIARAIRISLSLSLSLYIHVHTRTYIYKCIDVYTIHVDKPTLHLNEAARFVSRGHQAKVGSRKRSAVQAMCQKKNTDMCPHRTIYQKRSMYKWNESQKPKVRSRQRSGVHGMSQQWSANMSWKRNSVSKEKRAIEMKRDRRSGSADMYVWGLYCKDDL